MQNCLNHSSFTGVDAGSIGLKLGVGEFGASVIQSPFLQSPIPLCPNPFPLSGFGPALPVCL